MSDGGSAFELEEELNELISIEDRVKSEYLQQKIQGKTREIQYKEQVISGFTKRHADRMLEKGKEKDILEAGIVEHGMKISDHLAVFRDQTHPRVLMLTAAKHRLDRLWEQRTLEIQRENREHDEVYNHLLQYTARLKAELAEMQSELLAMVLDTTLDFGSQAME